MNWKKTTKTLGFVVLLLLLPAVIYRGYMCLTEFYELLRWEWEPPSPSQMPIGAGLVYMSARTNLRWQRSKKSSIFMRRSP